MRDGEHCIVKFMNCICHQIYYEVEVKEGKLCGVCSRMRVFRIVHFLG